MSTDTIRTALQDGSRISRTDIAELMEAYDKLANFATQNQPAPAVVTHGESGTVNDHASREQVDVLKAHVQSVCQLAELYISKINHNIILDPYVDEAEKRLKRAIELARKAAELMLDF